MGVKLDGRDPKEFGLIFLKDHYHPLTPEIRNKTLTIPGMSGEWDFGSEWGPRPFSLPFGKIEFNRMQLQRKLREFVAFLLDSKGRPRELKLSFDYEPEKYYMVKLSGMIEPQRLYNASEFTVPLKASDPAAYAELTYAVPEAVKGINYDEGYLYPLDPNEIYLSSEVYTFQDPIPFNEPYIPNYYYENPAAFQWNYSRQYSGIQNHSFYDTSLIVDIEGSVINPRITNQATGNTIYLPTIQGAKMKIDTGKFSVKVNDKAELLTVRGIEEFSLISGENPLVFEGGAPNATVTFKWKHKFM